MSRIKALAHNLRLLFSRPFTDYLGEIEQRLQERNDRYEKAADSRIDRSFAETERRLDLRMDERARALDQGLDQRFAQLEVKTDQRFEVVERRLDERMESHERRTDQYLLQSRTDIVDRTDVMLQIFEQRLDQQRREVRRFGESLAARGPREATTASTCAQTSIDPATLSEQRPAEQIQSFRKLAEGMGKKPNLQSQDGPTLYEKILDWKKVSQNGLNDFTPDEQEMVDYIMSFIGDVREQSYIMSHMRRLIGTLQRIPPPQSPADRLLELGSLLHIAPAIKKFSGYAEILGADFWETDKKISEEKLTQVKEGGESHTVALHNFNVEADLFPFPNGHFRVVLCCELIEHLQRDPMHMLWECNRVLAKDGYLLLTTPNIASCRSLEGLLIGCAPYLLAQYNRQTPVDQHNREYAPYEIGVALAAAGFTVLELETEDVWMRSNPAILELLKAVNLPTDKRGDNIFALARKTSDPIERYPRELYVE